MVIRAEVLFLLGGFLRGLCRLLRLVVCEGFAEDVWFKALPFEVAAVGEPELVEFWYLLILGFGFGLGLGFFWLVAFSAIPAPLIFCFLEDCLNRDGVEGLKLVSIERVTPADAAGYRQRRAVVPLSPRLCCTNTGQP